MLHVVMSAKEIAKTTNIKVYLLDEYNEEGMCYSLLMQTYFITFLNSCIHKTEHFPPSLSSNNNNVLVYPDANRPTQTTIHNSYYHTWRSDPIYLIYLNTNALTCSHTCLMYIVTNTISTIVKYR